MFVWSPMTTSTRPAGSASAKSLSLPVAGDTVSMPLWVMTTTTFAPVWRAFLAACRRRGDAVGDLDRAEVARRDERRRLLVDDADERDLELRDVDRLERVDAGEVRVEVLEVGGDVRERLARVARRSSAQPARSIIDCRWSMPLSKSWLPKVLTWMPIRRSALTAGTSSKKPASGGEAPKSSPAVSEMVG